jgi:hypothetical protein
MFYAYKTQTSWHMNFHLIVRVAVGSAGALSSIATGIVAVSRATVEEGIPHK